MFHWRKARISKRSYVVKATAPRNRLRNESFHAVSLAGDIALADGKPKVHAHAVLGKRDAAAVGGHLLQARVRPTLEVVLVQSPAHLERRHDPESGLALIRVRPT